MHVAAEKFGAEAFDADLPLVAEGEEGAALVDEIRPTAPLVPVKVLGTRVPTALCQRPDLRDRSGRGIDLGLHGGRNKPGGGVVPDGGLFGLAGPPGDQTG